MDKPRMMLNWKSCTLILMTAGGIAVGCYHVFPLGSSSVRASAAESRASGTPEGTIPVEVTSPRKGAFERTTSQPGTVLAFEQARLYAAVSGYLKTLKVDIGDRVKPGQVLATIAVPELDKQVQEYKALLARARAKVSQMKARVVTAKAELETAKAAIVQAEAASKSAQASRRFREKQLRRMKDLFALKSIDERLVDESMERSEAAIEAERAAAASVVTTRAQKETAEAKILQTDADVDEAEADVQVVQARLEKAQVSVDFATITSPYEGVITQRSLLPGDYVRGATEGSAGPLLTVERTDRMRVVVQVPDRDVPYTDPGDPAVVEIDALPGRTFPAKVSRIAGSQDPQTRLMRTEIDLLNPTGEIRQGMYGRVSIVLDQQKELLSLASSCLVGKTADRKGRVYVVRDGRARLISVNLGPDDGLHVAVRSGLSLEDDVVLNPGNELTDGAEVKVTLPAGATAASH